MRGLGNEQYGLYALMTGFIAYSFTFNIGRAITKYVAEYGATGATEKISQIISATFFLSLTVATVGGLTIVFLARPLVFDILQIQAEVREETVIAFYLAALCIWLLILGQVFSAVVQARHRFDVFSIITTLTNAVLIIGNVALVWLGYRFYHLVLWNAAAFFLSGAAFFIFARRLEPETKINLKFDKKIFTLAVKFGINVAAYQIFANILFIWERIVITRIEGADELTHYAVPMTIAVYIHAFISSITLNFVALSSALFAERSIEEMETIYRRVTKIVGFLVVFLCVALAVAGKPILTNWIDLKFAEAATEVFILQIIIFGSLAAMIVAWQFIEGFGHPFYNMMFNLVWLLISAPLMYVLTRRFGIEGTALAKLAGGIIIPFAIILIERKIFGRVLWNLWARIFLLLGAAGIAAGFAEYFILKTFSQNWLTIFSAIAASGLIYLLIVWFLFYFSPEEKRWLKGKLIKDFA